MKKRLPKNSYFTLNYLSRSRWNSLWIQIYEVVTKDPKSVLEIGSGSGINGYVLKQFGINVLTMDNDKKLHPDILGDVRKIPLKENSFDLVTCFQVLEHIKFSDVPKAITEICRVTKKYAVISIPEPYNSFVEIKLKLLPFVPRVSFLRKINPFPSIIKPLPVNGPHKWELNRPGFKKNQFEDILTEVGFKIVKTFYPSENLYHRFYVLEKI